MVDECAQAIEDAALELSRQVNPRFGGQFREYMQRSIAAGELQQFPNITSYPCLDEDTTTTAFDRYYFYQDTWAAKKVFRGRPSWLADVGSTVLYSGILSQFVPSTFIDIRPIQVDLPGYSTIPGSITELPFATESVPFLTSLCVVEHIGLGRYGDPIEPFGTHRAMAELDRVIRPGGELVVSTNVGPSCIAYNAHRIFQLDQFLAMLPGYELLDEVFLGPEPGGRELLEGLNPGDFRVYVGHFRKPITDRRRSQQEEERWAATGGFPPPHHVKIRNIARIREQYRLTGLLETGTYLGATTDALKGSFVKVATVELQAGLAKRAREMFESDARVKVYEGDSGARMPEMLDWLSTPSVLWLDGHWSGGFTARGQIETPIVEELRVASSRPGVAKAILIDDARLFTGTDGYPTLRELGSLAASLFPTHSVDVVDDAIRILPGA